MLNREICKKCRIECIEESFRYNLMDRTFMERMFKEAWAKDTIHCQCASNDVPPLRLDIDNPPVDCVYLLEQILSEEVKK